MVEKLLPLRFSILKLLNTKVEGLNPYEIYEELAPDYPNEKQCQPDTIDDHLMSMKGVGLVDEKSARYNEKQQLVTTYAITDYGKGKVEQYIG